MHKTLVTWTGSGTTIRAVIRRARNSIELRMAETLLGALSPENSQARRNRKLAHAVPADGFFISRSIVIR